MTVASRSSVSLLVAPVRGMAVRLSGFCPEPVTVDSPTLTLQHRNRQRARRSPATLLIDTGTRFIRFKLLPGLLINDCTKTPARRRLRRSRMPKRMVIFKLHFLCQRRYHFREKHGRFRQVFLDVEIPGNSGLKSLNALPRECHRLLFAPLPSTGIRSRHSTGRSRLSAEAF